MFNQDQDLIKEFNLGHLSEDKQAALLQQFYEALEARVSVALEGRLSDAQLLEFEKVNDGGDDQTTEAWLRQALPDYERIIAEQIEDLKAEIKHTAAQFKADIKED